MEEKTNTVAQVDNTIHFKARNINFSYIKEMIKKNKSVLILMFFGITVLGFLMGVSYSPYGYYSNSESPYEIFDYGDDINVFGVFISIAVPIVLATILNYWMYSRRNVDFIASMPINRRTMGISNIVLSTFVMLIISLAFIVALFGGALMSGKSIFFTQLINEFIFIFLSMLFMYGITYLSMVRVGNILAQGVVLLLLLFFVPLSNLIFMSLATTRYTFTQIAGDYAYFSLESASNYLPMPLCLLFGEKYQSANILNFKVIQSIIYIVIIYGVAQVLFERRKMENNQEGFSNLLIHEIVKCLTMIIPLVGIISSIISVNEFEFEWYMLVYVVLAIIYFFVFDLLMFKKVKFSYSMTVFGFLAAISIIISIPIAIIQEADIETKNYSEFDIDSISIELPLTGSLYEINDRTIIKRFMEKQSTRTTYGFSGSIIDCEIKLKNGKISDDIYIRLTNMKDFDYIFGNKQYEIAKFALEDLEKHSSYWCGVLNSDNNINSLYSPFSIKNDKSAPVNFREVYSRLKALNLYELYNLEYGNKYDTSSTNENSTNKNLYNYKYKKYIGYYYNGSDISRVTIYN